jgi:23S rRNA (pseudouridine1915-N3)-methyltransferase
MKVVVLAVGRMRERHLTAICDDYVARIRHHLPIEVVEVEDDAGLLRRLGSVPGSTDVIALEVGGEPWDTTGLTRFVEEAMVRGTRTVVFLIGGSDGLPGLAVARATRRLSLSAMTLPHRLARIVLCEQLYRAVSIIKGEPYHR